MPRLVVWLLVLAALGGIAYAISVPHSTRPCLVSSHHPCVKQPSETHM